MCFVIFFLLILFVHQSTRVDSTAAPYENRDVGEESRWHLRTLSGKVYSYDRWRACSVPRSNVTRNTRLGRIYEEVQHKLYQDCIHARTSRMPPLHERSYLGLVIPSTMCGSPSTFESSTNTGRTCSTCVRRFHAVMQEPYFWTTGM